MYGFLQKQGKSLASSLCNQNTGRLIRQNQNAKLVFGENLLKRFKIEKVNIDIKFFILVYSWVPNRRGVRINGRQGVENWKFNSQGGVEEILFDMLKQSTKKLKCFEFQMVKTSSSSVISSNTHSIKVTNKMRSIIGNKLASLYELIKQLYVGFFAQTCKTKHTTEWMFWVKKETKNWLEEGGGPLGTQE